MLMTSPHRWGSYPLFAARQSGLHFAYLKMLLRTLMRPERNKLDIHQVPVANSVGTRV